MRKGLAVVVGVALLASAVRSAAADRPAKAETVATKVQIVGPVEVQTHEKSDPTNQPCPNGVDVRTSDLCAQWKAADAAYVSNRKASQANWISVFGTLFSGVAMIGAIWSAIYATRTLNAERAWMMMDRVEPTNIKKGDDVGDLPDKGMRLVSTWKNSGRTPALEVFMDSQVAVLTNSETMPIFQPNFDNGPTMVGSNSEESGKAYWVSAENLRKMAKREVKVVIYEACQYRDIYSKKIRITEVCHHLTAEHAPESSDITKHQIVGNFIGKQNRAI